METSRAIGAARRLYRGRGGGRECHLGSFVVGRALIRNNFAIRDRGAEGIIAAGLLALSI